MSKCSCDLVKEIISEAKEIIEDEDGEEQMFEFILWLSELDED